MIIWTHRIRSVQTENTGSNFTSNSSHSLTASPPFQTTPPRFFSFFSFSFCTSDSRSGSEVVLRLLVPGGSGDWSLCTGRSRSSGHTAGTKERPRQEDGAAGGRAPAAPGTSSPYLTHHSAAKQPAASRKCYYEPGSGYNTYRGELG